jgi:uncharacterized membrane protein
MDRIFPCFGWFLVQRVLAMFDVCPRFVRLVRDSRVVYYSLMQPHRSQTSEINASIAAEASLQTEWRLKRNCSVTPLALMAVFAALSGLSAVIALCFAFFGAWVIIPFAGLEIAVLGTAFFLWSRHATDYERIAVVDGKVILQLVERERVVNESEWNPLWLKVDVVPEPLGCCKVWFRQQGKKIEVARYLDSPRKLQWMVEFKSALGALPPGRATAF